MDLKEKWINDTIDSIHGLKPAKASAVLEEQIIGGIRSGKTKIIYMSARVKWIAAACIAVLAVLNILFVVKFNQSTQPKTESNPLYSEYFSSNNNY